MKDLIYRSAIRLFAWLQLRTHRLPGGQLPSRRDDQIQFWMKGHLYVFRWIVCRDFYREKLAVYRPAKRLFTDEDDIDPRFCPEDPSPCKFK